jgi:nucleotide-binding universal stress UspA family protein
MYKRIIVPVDGSPTANKALVAALQLARDSGGRVRLIHVVEELAFVDGYDMYGGQTGELLQVMREAGDKVLDAALEIARSAGVEADKQLFDRFGERLGEVVANAARDWNADLIVLGTHGRRGIGRVLLGSGAEQIIRLAPTPVLVIRSGEETTPRPA